MPLPERQYEGRACDMTDAGARPEAVLTERISAPDPWCAIRHQANKYAEEEST